jgi:hypothetical protein
MIAVINYNDLSHSLKKKLAQLLYYNQKRTGSKAKTAFTDFWSPSQKNT